MASPISFSLGVLQHRLATSTTAHRQIDTRNQAITLLWKHYVLNRYVIIFHLLAVFNTLIIISPDWTERKLFPFTFESFLLLFFGIQYVGDWSVRGLWSSTLLICLFVWDLFVVVWNWMLSVMACGLTGKQWTFFFFSALVIHLEGAVQFTYFYALLLLYALLVFSFASSETSWSSLAGKGSY